MKSTTAGLAVVLVTAAQPPKYDQSCSMGDRNADGGCTCWPGFQTSVDYDSIDHDQLCDRTAEGWQVLKKSEWFPTSGSHKGDGFYLVSIPLDNTGKNLTNAFFGPAFADKTQAEKDLFWGERPKQLRGLWWMKGNKASLGALGNFGLPTEYLPKAPRTNLPQTINRVYAQSQWSFESTPRGVQQWENEMKMKSIYTFYWNTDVTDATVEPTWLGWHSPLSTILMKFTITLQEPCKSDPSTPSCQWLRLSTTAGIAVDKYYPTRIVDAAGKVTAEYSDWLELQGAAQRHRFVRRCLPIGGVCTGSSDPLANTAEYPTSNATPSWLQKWTQNNNRSFVVAFWVVLGLLLSVLSSVAAWCCKGAKQSSVALTKKGGGTGSPDQNPVNFRDVASTLS